VQSNTANADCDWLGRSHAIIIIRVYYVKKHGEAVSGFRREALLIHSTGDYDWSRLGLVVWKAKSSLLAAANFQCRVPHSYRYKYYYPPWGLPNILSRTTLTGKSSAPQTPGSPTTEMEKRKYAIYPFSLLTDLLTGNRREQKERGTLRCLKCEEKHIRVIRHLLEAEN
jgi:hypothetical protein